MKNPPLSGGPKKTDWIILVLRFPFRRREGRRSWSWVSRSEAGKEQSCMLRELLVTSTYILIRSLFPSFQTGSHVSDFAQATRPSIGGDNHSRKTTIISDHLAPSSLSLSANVCKAKTCDVSNYALFPAYLLYSPRLQKLPTASTQSLSLSLLHHGVYIDPRSSLIIHTKYIPHQTSSALTLNSSPPSLTVSLR